MIKKQSNHCKTEDEISDFFQIQDRKLWENHGFVYGEMDKIWEYARERQKLLNKCGERLRELNNGKTTKKRK